MKKLLTVLLLLTSLFGYLAWGNGKHAFLFQAEADVLAKAIHHPLEVLHPFVLIPFVGQLLLLFTLFQKQPGRLLTLLGLAALSILMVLLLLIGALSFNLKIAGSTLPFFVAAFLVVRGSRHARKER
jgi:hypothetical protein